MNNSRLQNYLRGIIDGLMFDKAHASLGGPQILYVDGKIDAYKDVYEQITGHEYVGAYEEVAR
jgi:hypothetical protein